MERNSFGFGDQRFSGHIRWPWFAFDLTHPLSNIGITKKVATCNLYLHIVQSVDAPSFIHRRKITSKHPLAPCRQSPANQQRNISIKKKKKKNNSSASQLRSEKEETASHAMTHPPRAPLIVMMIIANVVEICCRFFNLVWFLNVQFVEWMPNVILSGEIWSERQSMSTFFGCNLSPFVWDFASVGGYWERVYIIANGTPFSGHFMLFHYPFSSMILLLLSRLSSSFTLFIFRHLVAEKPNTIIVNL